MFLRTSQYQFIMIVLRSDMVSAKFIAIIFLKKWYDNEIFIAFFFVLFCFVFFFLINQNLQSHAKKVL